MAATTAMMLAMPAQAAEFMSQHGFDAPPGTDFCNTNVNTTAFATGAVLGHTDQSCSGGYTVALDTMARTITFTNIIGSPFGDYDYSVFNIDGITETTITSLSTIQFAPLFAPGLGLGDVVPTPLLSFTGSSIQIVFDATSTGDTFNFGGDGGQAIFSYNGVGVVPEPATWAFMIFGFGAIGGAMRRKAKVTTNVSYA